MISAFAALTGRTFRHYTVGRYLGKGGMGVVYEARDNRLNRSVALKILLPELLLDEERKRRFIHEARAASALNHPHIVTIHDIDSVDGMDFIVMELLQGETLAQRLERARLPVSVAIEIAWQIAEAISAAHEKGIVHRDLKPANIMVLPSGGVKVLDFGLAKLMASDPDENAPATTLLTETGVVVGTVSYMSPEQARGEKIDARSDIFSFGSLLYELVTGQRAFPGGNTLSILSSIDSRNPDPMKSTVAEVPQLLEDIVGRCHFKNPDERFQSMGEVREKLGSLRSSSLPTGASRRSPKTLRWVAAAAVAAVVVIGWLWQQNRNVTWAYARVPEVQELLKEHKYSNAMELAASALTYAPGDATLAQLLDDSSVEVPVTTDPPGAVVAVREYGSEESGWRDLGATPISRARIPRGPVELKFSKPEFQEAHIVWKTPAVSRGNPISRKLARAADVPEGMVYVPGETDYDLSLDGLIHIQDVHVADFYIDKFEVTNRQFKEFIEKGGYRRQEFWQEPFVENGRVLTFEQALEKFKDKTGQPGPETWELGDFPPGQGDYPVGGVSWYEAAAYARFVGKSLPPVSYWSLAARPELATEAVVPRGNFGGKGPQAVGSSGSMNASGALDMVGNVKEWCWNENDSGWRYALGGAWNTPNYSSFSAYTRSPFDRAPTNGFRLIHYIGEQPSAKELGRLVPLKLDHTRRTPTPDAEFKTYLTYYAYDAKALNPQVEPFREQQYWKAEKITFDAAYNNERMLAYLFLPKKGKPPYQTLIYFPGTGAQTYTSSEDNLETSFFEFLLRNGRAVLYPVYKGTYERGVGQVQAIGSMAHKETRVEQAKDFKRSVDYLESRPDIDKDRLGFYGISWGGAMGAFIPAVEKRLKVSVLLLGGFRMEVYQAEVDPFNFAPRVKVPTLMLNGEFDSGFKKETQVEPMFKLLGSSDKQIRYFPSGHEFLPIEFAKESLPWLDQHLGKVNE